MSDRQSGTVKWFNDAKGFGFITPEDGGEDLFAHFSAIQMEGFRTLKQGARVQYEVSDGPKGKLALLPTQERMTMEAELERLGVEVRYETGARNLIVDAGSGASGSGQVDDGRVVGVRWKTTEGEGFIRAKAVVIRHRMPPCERWC